MERLLVDSGFFFALFEPRDQHHADARERQEWLEIASVVIPWPIFYETINTRHARRPDRIARFESIVRAPTTEFVDDSPYRLDAFDEVLLRGKQQRHPMSLVDAVLISILADANVKIDAMLTFNHGDFSSICSAKGVVML